MRFFDLHCDTLYKLAFHCESILKNNFHVSLSRARKYEPYIGCFAIWIPDDLRGEKAFEFFNECKNKFEFEIENCGYAANGIKSASDLDEFAKTKKSGLILTLEGSSALMGDISKVRYIREAGVKIITLTWNGACEAGDGVNVENAAGITDFGKKLLKEMETYSIIADVSHASEKLFYDIYSLSTRPFIATHSNSKKICPHRRNLTDDQFNCIKGSGGIVGVTFCSEFLSNSSKAGFDDVLKHVEHFLSLGGENTLSIGSDFDGADVPDNLSGIECVENLYEYFLVKNYSEEILDKIFFSNAYSFIKNFTN